MQQALLTIAQTAQPADSARDDALPVLGRHQLSPVVLLGLFVAILAFASVWRKRARRRRQSTAERTGADR